MARYFNNFEFQVCFLTRSREELLNLKSKEGDFSNIELTIIFCVIYFSFDLEALKSGEVYPAIHRSGCRVLLKALQ